MRLPGPFALALLAIPAAAPAQQRDSFFDDYAAYADFVDSHIVNRDFITLIQVLGGRDEYTIEELQRISNRMMTAYPTNFVGRAVSKQVELDGGFRQEMRIYWNAGTGYLYFYAFLHQRDDALVVLTFTMNSDSAKIFERF